MPTKDSIKNAIKKALRAFLSCVNGLGFGLLMHRLGRGRGGVIVMTHCIGHVPETDYLPPDMKTSEEKVERLLKALRRRGVRATTVREVVGRLDLGDPAPHLLGFTMDDGYRDNYTRAMPLLKRYGATATVFVETRAVSERRVSWMHRYFFIAKEKGEPFFVDEYLARTRDEKVKQALKDASANRSALGPLYDFKRVLKYEADREDRDRVTLEILESIGRSDADIAPAYLTWEEIAEMDRAGFEFGAHTVHHEILSRLSDREVEEEIEQSTREVERRVKQPVTTFAYPFGRDWDYDERCFPVLERLGYKSSCAAMEGRNRPATDRWRLRRLPLNDEIPLGHVLAELDGTFDLARRLLGVKL